MTARDVLAETLAATFDGSKGEAWRLALLSEDGGLSPNVPPEIADAILESLAARGYSLLATPQPEAGLDAAWAEAEVALPDGWRGPQLRTGYQISGKVTLVEYEASIWCWIKPHTPSRIAKAPTPAAALRALADKLREPKS